ncbi:hypothetical protein NDK43_30165 [Neobacillus pocheonensis]|uniref:Antirepressor AbbA n=1 Tax=Neobacillus pocheonensis TaxID=363869 RepID=A0ABT0WHI1_9BACI|nr:hypothetical protein [Neobacillus pocheonensis]
MEKEYLVEELDQLLFKTEESGYLLKERLEDQELNTILQLLQQEPNLQKRYLTFI